MILPQVDLEIFSQPDRIGRLDEAEKLAAQAVGDYPEDGRLRLIQGLIRHRLRDFPGARSALESAARLAPLEPSVRSILADCFARTGGTREAAGIYRTLAADDCCPISLLPAIASGLGDLGEYEAALDACRDIIRRDPGHHQAHFGVAFYLRRLGQPPQEVLPAVIRAHELAPDEWLYRVSVAVLLDAGGFREEACDLLRGINPCAAPCRCSLRKVTEIFLATDELRTQAIFRPRAAVPQPAIA